ncbi:hypothetical protein CDD83_8137 [Cordyceps sp. RAO-2017]|nr:hypothetical protein CDD83_8137 [Cordyceps sp. RAO-2017]
MQTDTASIQGACILRCHLDSTRPGRRPSQDQRGRIPPKSRNPIRSSRNERLGCLESSRTGRPHYTHNAHTFRGRPVTTPPSQLPPLLAPFTVLPLPPRNSRGDRTAVCAAVPSSGLALGRQTTATVGGRAEGEGRRADATAPSRPPGLGRERERQSPAGAHPSIPVSAGRVRPRRRPTPSQHSKGASAVAPDPRAARPKPARLCQNVGIARLFASATPPLPVGMEQPRSQGESWSQGGRPPASSVPPSREDVVSISSRRRRRRQLACRQARPAALRPASRQPTPANQERKAHTPRLPGRIRASPWLAVRPASGPGPGSWPLQTPGFPAPCESCSVSAALPCIPACACHAAQTLSPCLPSRQLVLAAGHTHAPRAQSSACQRAEVPDPGIVSHRGPARGATPAHRAPVGG